MKIFFTSDTHFYHTNIIKYEDRPFIDSIEMNNYIIDKWNSKVNKNDEVYHLGDFAFAPSHKIESLLSELNGRIYLIYGNHDKEIKKNKSLQNKFIWCKDYYLFKLKDLRIVLFHYPIAVWDRQHHDSLHFYGHIHNNTKTNHPLTQDLKNAYNVGVDVQNYEPKTIEEII
jgi:calcineurin-like phosphoesterase family protein